MKQHAAKYHYVFVGQHATTGTPHKQTGRMSNYGGYVAFKNKADAIRYAEEYYNPNNFYEFAKHGTVNTLRKYSLGDTWYNYLDELLLLDALSYDENGNLI